MFNRVCIDIDHRGNTRGISVELHGSDGPTTVWTTSVGPFDDPRAALESALLELHRLVGEQGALF